MPIPAVMFLSQSILSPYLPAGIYLALLVATGVALLSASKLLGPRRVSTTKRALESYECGVPPKGTSREQFPVKFYLVAILFVLFDIETVFLVPWAVVFRRFGMAAVIEMLVFLVILSVGLLYVWKRKGLEWD